MAKKTPAPSVPVPMPVLKSTRAILLIVAEFDEVPNPDDVESWVDDIRGSGSIQRAELQILKPYTRTF